MKNNIILLIFFICASKIIVAQNVGIGTATPLYPLHLQTPGNISSWGLMHTNGNVYLGSFIYQNGIAEFGTRSNHPFYLFANNNDNPPAIAIDNLGINVGIGNASPLYNLDIHSAGNAQLNLREGIGGQTALLSRYTNRLELQPSDAFEISIGGIDRRNLCVANSGYVGIETSTPTNLLQVGGYTNANYGGNQLALGFGTNVTVMNQYASLSNFQTTTALNIQSAKDMYLMPENGSGKVGINTNAPGYALDVNGSVYIDGAPDAPALTISGGSVFTPPSSSNSLTNCSGFCGFDGFSILANGPIQAAGFFATSDARFKDIKDISNSSNDLETLNSIKITDYTLKDKRMSGDRLYKKVIAQQVEQVYPQVVSRGVNYIPNVYQFTNKIEQLTNGYLLTFTNKHNISKEAKKIQLQDGNKMHQYNIIAVPSENQVIINGIEIKSDTVFVYGEMVNDFRSVDYDGLTTLNISATQELSKIIKQQQADIDTQDKKIKDLNTKLEALTEEVKSLQHK